MEIKPPKFLRRPGQPSKAEKDAHDTLHVNYRSWCRYCVVGKGQHRHHRSKARKKNKKKKKPDKGKGDKEGEGSTTSEPDEDDEALIPMVSMDYCFMGTHRIPAKRVPVLIIRDEFSKSLMAYMVGRKGVVDWVVDNVVKDLGDWGYGSTRIAIKTTQDCHLMGGRRLVAYRMELLHPRHTHTHTADQ